MEAIFNSKPEKSELSAKAVIVRSAEELFAEKGIEATSLREIAVKAGQKNTNAVQYHFGSKEQLVRVIWQRHSQSIDRHRALLLETLDDKDDIRRLIEVIVQPVIAKMNDPDGGVEFILIMSQLVSSPGETLLQLHEMLPERSVVKVMKYLAKYTRHLSETDMQTRVLFVLGIIFHGIADYIRLRKSGSKLVEGVTPDDLSRNLATTISAILSAR
ncbi:MAG: helix-turn-helix transcriptional regulator [Pseudomonadales bacterium]|nr:helix-turn-helix transcriptional regulator [Pseudomonadales bacterium]